jgi:hypothetical protein
LGSRVDHGGPTILAMPCAPAPLDGIGRLPVIAARSHVNDGGGDGGDE